ncbi:MAG: hypothetical protein JWP76_1243 [Dactylosporangium sp.]|nr:hypothetical protein [Dactylosporangium sp.]
MHGYQGTPIDDIGPEADNSFSEGRSNCGGVVPVGDHGPRAVLLLNARP